MFSHNKRCFAWTILVLLRSRYIYMHGCIVDRNLDPGCDTKVFVSVHH